MRLAARPLTTWPGTLTASRARRNATFDVTWTKTLRDLEREITHLAGYDVTVVLEMAIDERDCRLDGGIRAGTNPRHPGVIISFDAPRLGPLKFWTDRFHDWQHNVRAIGLYLSHQRAAERYGLGTGNEAYQGWKQLGTGIALGPAPMTHADAIAILAELGETTLDIAEGMPDATFRHACLKHHPDVGGDPDTFRRLITARNTLAAR